MRVVSTAKYVRISPKKARLVARELSNLNAVDAKNRLAHVNKKSADIIKKVLTSAIADAEHNHNLKKESLMLKNVVVDQGPSYSRFRARARGAAAPIQKRTSHVKVILEGDEFLTKAAKPLAQPVDISWEDLEKQAKEEKAAKKPAADEKSVKAKAESFPETKEDVTQVKEAEEVKEVKEVSRESWSENVGKKGGDFVKRFFRRKSG